MAVPAVNLVVVLAAVLAVALVVGNYLWIVLLSYPNVAGDFFPLPIFKNLVNGLITILYRNK